MAFIEINSVSKTYGNGDPTSQVHVLADIQTAIREAEFVALMGPSGSGKSTLLTVVGAMNRPTAGSVLVDGIDVYQLSDERRADFRREYLGFVFQQHHLLPYLNTIENVMLPLATCKLTSREKRERAMLALDKVGLTDKASRLPNQLSGGEQGRVAIARAIVNEPPVLLADEPTGTLDTKTGAEIMQVFLTLNRQGQTIFMVTHNPENGALAHRIIHIRDGRLVSDEALANGAMPVNAPTVSFAELTVEGEART